MERFAFGENWRNFSKRLTNKDYLNAKKSVRELVGDLSGKTVLDIGCGSGLFSIAASALGAKKVVGFDYDPQCVFTAKDMLEHIRPWDSKIKADSIEFSANSILNDNLPFEPADLVYSWGVLHHTGDMYKAFEASARLVAKKGTLAIAIYNKHFTSPVWKMIKYTYVKSPAIIKKLLVWLVLIVKVPAVMLTSRRNPFSKERGMSYYTDIVDWVGGFPYEYASSGEIIQFFEQRGFKLKKLVKTQGFTGCNEFVFERIA
jgi:2-polyprenyl-6-hydroxyphenyl methylase/3-demethylubiquinone-9 3-methyltransferase